ncbi:MULTISPECIES: hypothetical protein [Chryseobacterium]|uniref:hypothetical protein n=1 Tax=Chryseobacterium TaxID=59732 RepID=UPI000FB51EE4|nr:MULTISPECIES: hypothetical protein [Chryseobacterium]MBM7420553.1 hypothetical protein [Chryseobacterium sp. JUb44]MBW3522315.1 hypothetical protein [Chryseobacterium sp. NKUCC03_KSP]MDH6210503.1 hypothetical protein [Chryseobacterium sp. BIGb0186]WSO09196.1 hypothetical protein VUJ64_15315 [Chryseobacterium scophthalmum]
MERNNDKKDYSIIEKNIITVEQKNEEEKEELLHKLIVKIIVSLTLKEYYETCDKISKIQSTGTK